MFATLLMYHEEFTSEYPENPVSKEHVKTALKVGITEDELIIRGHEIRTNFKNGNCKQMIPPDAVYGHIIGALLGQIQELSSTVLALTTVAGLTDVMKAQNIRFEQFISSSPNHKYTADSPNSSPCSSTSTNSDTANSTEIVNTATNSLSCCFDAAVKKRKSDGAFLPGTHMFKDVMSTVFHEVLIEQFDHKVDTKVVDRSGHPLGWDCVGKTGESKKHDKSR